VEVLAGLEGLALEEAVRPLGPAAKVDRECSVNSFVLLLAVWRVDGELGGKLATIGNLGSIASL